MTLTERPQPRSNARTGPSALKNQTDRQQLTIEPTNRDIQPTSRTPTAPTRDFFRGK